MDKFAIIQLGGKQFKVAVGDFFEVERQSKLDIKVLSYFDGKKLEIGEPTVSGIEVKAKILEDKLAPKINVMRFKSKSRYRKKKGHRQPMSVVEITSIGKKTAKKATPTKETTAKKTAPKKTTSKKEKK
jgi:large subunit ribosomal protein L21